MPAEGTSQVRSGEEETVTSHYASAREGFYFSCGCSCTHGRVLITVPHITHTHMHTHTHTHTHTTHMYSHAHNTHVLTCTQHTCAHTHNTHVLTCTHITHVYTHHTSHTCTHMHIYRGPAVLWSHQEYARSHSLSHCICRPDVSLQFPW